MIYNFAFFKRYDMKTICDKIERTDDIKKKYDKMKKRYGNKYESLLNHKLFENGNLLVIKENKFPYDIYKNLKHYVLWIHPVLKTLITIQNARFIIEKKWKSMNSNNMIIFENKDKCKSIKTIRHLHVIINFKKEDDK
jgi:hypothetical protein